MPSRKRASQGDDSQQLPLREKRRRTQQAENAHGLEGGLVHVEEPIAKRALRSNASADVSISLSNAGLPELASSQPTAKKLHVRFESEDPPPSRDKESEASSIAVRDTRDVNSEDDSDDEAPEAISHAQAEAHTRATQAEEGRLHKLRELEHRDKRRERDAKLKNQVEKSIKRQRAIEQSEKEDQEQAIQDFESLPNFLPEEVLAAEAPVRLPTLPSARIRRSKVKKLTGVGKARKQEEQVLADVVRGGVKLRVLQNSSKALPPKASGKSRSVKDAWMKGRAAFQQGSKKGTTSTMTVRRAGNVAFA